jgi:hypothetical protein
MRLNANLSAAIVTLLFLMSMVGMRDSMADRWVAEERPYTYRAIDYAPAPPPDPVRPRD